MSSNFQVAASLSRVNSLNAGLAALDQEYKDADRAINRMSKEYFTRTPSMDDMEKALEKRDDVEVRRATVYSQMQTEVSFLTQRGMTPDAILAAMKIF